MKNKNLISYLAILFLNIFNNIEIFANDELIKAKNEWIKCNPMAMRYIQKDMKKQFNRCAPLYIEKCLSLLILEGHDINCCFDNVKSIVKKYGAFIKDRYIRAFCESFESEDYPVSDVISVLKDEINIIKNHRDSYKNNTDYYQDINLYTRILGIRENIELRLNTAQFFIDSVDNISIEKGRSAIHIRSNSNPEEMVIVLEQFTWEDNILKKYIQQSLALFESYDQISFLEKFSKVRVENNRLLSRRFQVIIDFLGNELYKKMTLKLLKEFQSVLPNLQPIRWF